MPSSWGGALGSPFSPLCLHTQQLVGWGAAWGGQESCPAPRLHPASGKHNLLLAGPPGANTALAEAGAQLLSELMGRKMWTRQGQGAPNQPVPFLMGTWYPGSCWLFWRWYFGSQAAATQLPEFRLLTAQHPPAKLQPLVRSSALHVSGCARAPVANFCHNGLFNNASSRS